MNTNTLRELNLLVRDLNLTKAFEFLLTRNMGKLTFSTSFGQEDQVLAHHIFSNELPIEVFTLDTGRLFQETYDVFNNTVHKYQKPIKSYFPNASSIEQLLSSKGPNSFYKSIENRKECCAIRKIEPLQRALNGSDVWITGLRAEQSPNRSELRYFEFDESFGILKFNPLLKWSLSEIETYLEENGVPQNALHKKGFLSIGCAPCTRAISAGEDIRAGRWWWESSQKECGLHAVKR